MLFFLLMNVKMPTIVGIFTFVSRKNFMLSSVEHEIIFITSGPGWIVLDSNIQIVLMLIFQTIMIVWCRVDVLWKIIYP